MRIPQHQPWKASLLLLRESLLASQKAIRKLFEDFLDDLDIEEWIDSMKEAGKDFIHDMMDNLGTF